MIISDGGIGSSRLSRLNEFLDDGIVCACMKIQEVYKKTGKVLIHFIENFKI
ncbi:MAG: hypothetical protein ACRC57_00190 [Sarcina sp.]